MGQDALALGLLDTEDHVVVATVDNLGRPPVFFVHDEDNSIYWVSSTSARHSANIRQHAEVALALFSTAPAVGLYIEATAEEVNDPVQLERAVPYVQSKKQPDKFRVNGLADVSADAEWRIYRARPRAGSRRADAYESEQAVTVRRPIDLPKADQLGRGATTRRRLNAELCQRAPRIPLRPRPRLAAQPG